VKLTTRSRGEIEAAPDPRGLDNFCRTNSVSNLSATATLAGEPNLTAALNLAASGLPVFPAGPDKRPLLAGWQEKATIEEEQIRRWWDTPAAVPAIVVGRAGLVVIDCDRHPGGNDGIEAFNRLLRANGGNLADVPMTRTARGGAHLFFKQPKGEPFGNARGELPDGIDVRGVGGFVIAPGAVLPNGQSWRPISGTPLLAEAFKAGTIPELPKWLVDIIRPNRQPNGNGSEEHARNFAKPGANGSLRGRAYAAAALDGAVAELSAAPNGKRNEILNAMAFRLGRMIERGWVDEKP
jgi:hypothetical protein